MKKEREQRMNKTKGVQEEGGEFDDLVSALLSAEVFDRDSSKFNKKKQRSPRELGSRERPTASLSKYQDK